MKLRVAKDDDGTIRGYVFHCPGCEHGHIFYTSGNDPRHVWQFDGNMESPTFDPSLMNRWPASEGRPHPDPKKAVCHLHLIRGQLRFHADCTHDWAGKVYDLPDI